MHNGAIGEFAKIKRRLRASLDDAAYESIQGTTDSEHALAVFLTLIRDGSPDSASALVVTRLGAREKRELAPRALEAVGLGDVERRLP